MRRPSSVFITTSLVGAALAVAGCGGTERAASPTTPAGTSGTSPTTPQPPIGPWHKGHAVDRDFGDETSGPGATVVFPRTDDTAIVTLGAGTALIPASGDPDDAQFESFYDGTAVAGTPAFDRQGRGFVVNTDGGKLTWGPFGADGMTGPPGGTLAARAEFPEFSANRDGDAAVAWLEGSGESYRALVSLRPRGGSFGPPITVSTKAILPYLDGNGPKGNSLTVAVGADGKAVVAGWVRDDTGTGSHIAAWTGSVSGGIDPAPITVAPKLPGEAFTAAVGTGGRAFVAWGWQTSGEDPDSPWLLQSSTIAPGARTAVPVKTLDRGAIAFPLGFPKFAADTDGGALLAYNPIGRHKADDPDPIRVLRVAKDGAYGGEQTLMAQGALTGLLVAPSGAAIVTWTGDGPDAYSGDPTPFYAAVRPATGKRFGPAETVPIPFGRDAPTPTFDPHGRPVIAYSVPHTSGVRGDRFQLLVRDKP